jgi:hypothetical protein
MGKGGLSVYVTPQPIKILLYGSIFTKVFRAVLHRCDG